MKTNKIRVHLKVCNLGKARYKVVSIKGDLLVPDWDVNGKETPVSPGGYISDRGAHYLVNTSSVYDVTVTA